MSLEIRELTTGDLREAAAVLASGMRDNPLHVEVFGTRSHKREMRLLRVLGHLIVYVHANGQVLGAFLCGKMVGVLGMIAPGRCRPAPTELLRFASVIVASNPPGGVWRVLRWLAAWARIDPSGPHWHVGPFAVRPPYRRRGIGRRLMSRCCQRMDALGASAYLETDLAINVAFYETLGFMVIRQEFVLGVPNWFMNRPPPLQQKD